MSLGERIYKLRTEKNLSQGDLAELLEVSRQSVSKWENNSATPDLEKILRLGEIFEVSLDELVKGEAKPYSLNQSEDGTESKAPEEVKFSEPSRQEAAFPTRKLVGIILFCMAFLVVLVLFAVGGGVAGLVPAIPFLLCGTICFISRKRPGLWCSWALYVCAEIFLRFAVGINGPLIVFREEIRNLIATPTMVVSWIVFLIKLVLVAVTVYQLSKEMIGNKKPSGGKLLLWWGCYIVVMVGSYWVFQQVVRYLLVYILSGTFYYTLAICLSDCCKTIVLILALVNTICYIRERRITTRETT